MNQVKWKKSQKFGPNRNKKRHQSKVYFPMIYYFKPVGISFASAHQQLQIMLLPFRFARWPSKEWV